MSLKPLVIYHGNCADGFGAAFAAWMKLGDEAEYLPMHYGKEPDDYRAEFNPIDRDVYIVDFSFQKSLMEDIFEYARRVVWLDHHKTAFEMWCGKYGHGMRHRDALYDILLDDNKSGAMLAWEYFHPGTEVPMLIRHIDDYDRWQFKLDGTKEFNKALWSYAPWSFEQWKQAALDPETLHDLKLEGAAILRAHEQNVQSVVKGAARECFIPHADCPAGMERDIGYAEMGLAANCPPHLSSDVGHALATTSGTFGLLWYIAKDGTCRCSLRSNGDYDVSTIAKAFGGGGHKNAAGFSVDIQTLMGWIK